MPAIVSGPDLLVALLRTPLPVRWIRDGVPASNIDPAMALCIAKGGLYEGKITGGRVKLIRELPSPKRNPYLACWLNSDAAVLRFG